MAKRKSKAKSKRSKKSPSATVTKRVKKSAPETPFGVHTLASTAPRAPQPMPAHQLMQAEPTRELPRPRKAAPPHAAPVTMAQLYEALAALLVPYARKMESEMHPKIGFCLKAKNARTGREAHFGAVQALPDGVAFHLFPLYGHPELLEGLSPELFNRLRSKTHFHLESLERGTLTELKELTHRAFESFVAEGMT
jgi:hypothetical protein